MNDISELFWNASVEDIKRGYIYNTQSGEYICLVCGAAFTRGIIYQEDKVLYEAEKYTQIHIEKEHTSMFDYLVNLDKKLTGLTDHQRNLLTYFYKGYSDSDIVKELDGGSTSTIRNHRFTLREKEKQARVYLAIMELLDSNPSKRQKLVNIHRSATMVDERYAVTEEENEKVLKAYFKDGLDGPLAEFPAREKKKIIVLKHIMNRFDVNKKYKEKEINEKLKEIYNDFVTIRRYLIEYGFMDREKDGSLYWAKV